MKKFLWFIFFVVLLVFAYNLCKPDYMVDCFGNNAYAANYVMFNKKSHIYHSSWREWAQKCTVNCIPISRQEAIRRGGRACRICGGR